MAQEFAGLAVPHGVKGTITFSGGNAFPSNAKWYITQLDVETDYELKQDMLDPSTAEAIGRCRGREVVRCNVTCMPASDSVHSVANAEAAFSAVPDEAVDKVTIASAEPDEANGDYLIDGPVRKNAVAEGFASLSLTLKRYTGASTDTLITVVS